MRRVLPSPLLATMIAASLTVAAPATADIDIPVLVPVTGFLSLEGTAQRNGAVLAARQAPDGLQVSTTVTDTATSPEKAVTALERALRDEPPALVGSMLGTQMLAMLPVIERAGVPTTTVSGTAKVTELGNPWIFRFFPGDTVVKVAHARYAVETVGAKRPALLYQTSAYGQSGREHLAKALDSLGAPLVLEEGLDTSVKDMAPALARVRAAEPDVLLLHLHAPATALVVRQAHESGLGLPIVAGSAMHQPTTAALLDPAQLRGVCAESASSPVSAVDGPLKAFADAYREAFGSEPDAFALGQYDGLSMVLAAMADGATSRDAIRDWLSSNAYDGLAMTYKSNGKGDMAHDAVIVCYDGESRVPAIVARYENVGGAR